MQLALNGAGGAGGAGGVGQSGGLAPGRAPAAAPDSGVPAAQAATPAALAPLPGAAGAAGADTSGWAARSGPLALEPSFHIGVAGGQQALAYLQTLAGQLQTLQSDLSARLAAGTAADAGLQARLDDLTASWSDREQRAAGSLDGQLNYSSPPQAVQRFSVRGLDLASLQSGDKETITLALNAAGQRMVSVSILPGLSAADIVQRFSQALAPAGVQVASDAGGVLVFSVAEASWPAVRDSLQIQGNGVRFAAGRLVRVRADPEPAAIQPSTWAIGSTGAMRTTLRNLRDATALVRQAQAAASTDLAAASARLEAVRPPQDPAWSATAAQRFQALCSQPGYAATSSMAAAVAGIQRSRVVSLLALPVTQTSPN